VYGLGSTPALRGGARPAAAPGIVVLVGLGHGPVRVGLRSSGRVTVITGGLVVGLIRFRNAPAGLGRISEAAQRLLLISSGSGTAPLLSTMPLMEQGAGGVLAGTVNVVAAAGLVAPPAREPTDRVFTSAMSSTPPYVSSADR
jgi:hypothetical protein